MADLPFPWGNLSLGLDTEASGEKKSKVKMFTWFGSTTVVLGEVNLTVVLQQVSGVNTSPKKGDPPVLVSSPRQAARTATQFRLAFSEIHVNFRLNQSFFIPAATFAIFWALSYDVQTVHQVLASISTCGLWNRVERWVSQGTVWVSNHAGLMLTGRATTCPEANPKKTTLTAGTSTGENEEEVPSMYRCWAPAGNHISHIPPTAVWHNWQPAADWQLDPPNIMSL